jgi:hypothetical protein
MQSLLLLNDFIALTHAEVSLIHPGSGTQISANEELLKTAKSSFVKKLEQLRSGDPISPQPIEVNTQIVQTDSVPTNPEVEAAPSVNIAKQAFQAENVMEDEFPNQEFSSEIFRGLQTKNSIDADSGSEKSKDSITTSISTEHSPETVISRERVLEQTLDRTVSELSQLFAPKRESAPLVFTSPVTKTFSLPENLTKPIDRESALEYSSRFRHLDKHYTLNRSINLNRMQKARNLVGKGDGWSGAEVDFLLGREQDELVRSGQQSLRQIFENLTDELLIDEVYADPDIAQQLLTILSILPPCPSIFAVQQELMIFIDLDHVTLSSEHLLAVSNMMAEVGGSLEMHHDGVRLSCPSSLLRLPMAFFTRHGEYYAVSAIQYLGEESFTKPVDSKIDFLGEIIHPARSIYIRVGHQEYVIYAHEFLGVQNMNLHQNLPTSLERPYWMGGVALDGANKVYSWVALDRYSR